MARDVMRHRLVLSFEALSDNVTADDVLTTVLQTDPGAGRAAPGAFPRPRRRLSARRLDAPPPAADRGSATARLERRRGRAAPTAADPSSTAGIARSRRPRGRHLRSRTGPPAPRLEGHPPPRRRPPGRLPKPLPRQRHRSGRPARVPARRRRAVHRLERHRPHGHAVRPRVRRGSRDHGLVPAGPQPLGRLRHAWTRERVKRTVLIDFVATLARLLTRRGNRVGAMFYGSAARADDPGPGRPRPGPAAHRRPARTSRAWRTRRSRTWRRCSRAGAARDQAPLAGLHRLGLHQRSRAGSGRSACSTGGTKSWPSGCSTRARSSCRTWAR